MAGLLERLAGMTRCAYLSDLRQLDKAALAGALRRIPARAYSVKEWMDAAHYLAGLERPFDSPAAVRSALLEYLILPL